MSPLLTDRTRERYPVFAELLQRPEMSGRWLILTHDNPDPDALAAAAVLGQVLRRAFKRRVTTAYGGIIGRAENQEMVKVLRIKLSHVRHLNWRHYKHFALVDTQPDTGNNQLPSDIVPDVVFDHHPVRRATRKARFVDIRTDYGATATILAEYQEASALEYSKQEATALVYAIRSETQDFGREFTAPDKETFDTLFTRADYRALARIQTPRLSLRYFKTLHHALENVEEVSTLVVTHLGEIDQPDIVPEIADLLLRLEGKTWSLCSGVFGTRLYLSIRTTNSRGDAGRLMRRLLGRMGKGGGHGMMAGGYIDLEKARNGGAESIRRRVVQRLARALKKNPDKLTKLTFAAPSDSPPG
jgi:nanoRNase/pAp phosphatase (c-di-AMP/oligoRNAs hydrolase)